MDVGLWKVVHVPFFMTTYHMKYDDQRVNLGSKYTFHPVLKRESILSASDKGTLTGPYDDFYNPPLFSRFVQCKKDITMVWAASNNQSELYWRKQKHPAGVHRKIFQPNKRELTQKNDKKKNGQHMATPSTMGASSSFKDQRVAGESWPWPRIMILMAFMASLVKHLHMWSLDTAKPYFTTSGKPQTY